MSTPREESNLSHSCKGRINIDEEGVCSEDWEVMMPRLGRYHSGLKSGDG
jgi:hypothetical protein